MPYEIIRYHCNICGEPHRKHADAVRCERLNHQSRTVWPAPAALAKAKKCASNSVGGSELNALDDHPLTTVGATPSGERA